MFLRRSCETLFCFLLGDPFIRALIEEVERQGSAIEHLVMKSSQIEFRAQRFLGAIAELTELELAKLVAERLSRPGDVAIGFRLNGRLVDGAGLAHEFHDLVA